MRGSVRNRSKVPTIHNVEKYGVDVLRWWKSLQPPRRVQDSQPPYSPETFSRNGGAWGDLVRGGSSGIYTVLMAVAWWVATCGESIASELASLINDMAYVIGEMVKSLGARDQPPIALPGRKGLLKRGGRVPPEGQPSSKRIRG